MMRKTKAILILFTLFPTLLACNASATPSLSTPKPGMTTIVEWVPTPTTGAPLTEADVPRLSLEEARAVIASGAAVVIDVRSPEAFAVSHISGALNIPLRDIEVNPTLRFDKDQSIITYCT